MAKVLVIDDDAAVLGSIAAIMERVGHEVVQAEDGLAGIQALEDFDPDLVITDINMPEMDGIEVIMGLLQSRPELPIIAISGGGRVDKGSLLEDAAACGAGKTLRTPFELAELVEAVNASLAPAGGD